MADFSDLHVLLRRQDAESYSITLNFQRTDSDAATAPEQGVVRFNDDALRDARLNPTRYGRLLSDAFFADARIRTFFNKAYATAQALEMPLRLRLDISDDAAELQALRWETLRSPRAETGAVDNDDSVSNAPVTDSPPSDSLLLSGDSLLFSRFLPSDDWRPVRLRPRADLQALVVIANPSNPTINGRTLPPLSKEQMAAYEKQMQESLEGIPCTLLTAPGAATLDNIISELRLGYDVIYLMCHGALTGASGQPRQPKLWLEKAAPLAGNPNRGAMPPALIAGSADVVAGAEFVARLSEMEQRPRLVVLASCQSAGSGDDDGLEALGPQLARAGIPAVLAMRGEVTQETAAQFTRTFFTELRRDGQIDRAAGVARGAVRNRSDWWMPTLFMRLKSGSIWWYERGFTERQDAEFELWPLLITHIHARRCTVFLGPGANNPTLGSPREIAHRWAAEQQVPLAPLLREELPQVAQYLAIAQDDASMRHTYVLNLCRELMRRYGAHLSPAMQAKIGAVTEDFPDDALFDPETLPESLHEVFAEVGQWRRKQNPNDLHRILAGLPLRRYVLTTPDGVLADALREAGKQPQEEFFRWSNRFQWPASIYDNDNTAYRPSDQSPLVYHLFGCLTDVKSLILTQDNYFDFVIGVTRNNDLIPEVVRRAAVQSSLLFLGFDLDDWDFRVLLRSIINREANLLGGLAHVAVQIDPESGRFLDSKRARHYLSRLLRAPDINIYWGSAEDFVTDLRKRWNAPHAGEPRG